MKAANLNKWPGNPVLSCRVLPKFCFVSLRHEDEATAALNMDGIHYRGQRLRLSIRILHISYPDRPVDYGGPITNHKTWQDICPDIVWEEMYDATGMEHKWIIKELEELPPDVIALCSGSDESSLSPYLEISNLVTAFDVENKEDQPELIEEFREEFEQYGVVKNIVIPSAAKYKEKVFVEFDTTEQVFDWFMRVILGENSV